MATLEGQTLDPIFWNDHERAKIVSQRITGLKKLLDEWKGFEQKLDELSEFATVADTDVSLQQEIEVELSAVEAALKQREFYLLLSEPHDQGNCFVSVHAGTGGVDAQDCAAIILRMYLRYADRKGFKADMINLQEGEEAGIKKATIEISGDFAYGLLKGEAGVHRIVRLSPYNAQNLRQTSFVLVEVMPVVDQGIDIQINQDDLKIDTFKSSGAGGQHVNKTSSAVRITHVPSGIIVACQQERSQLQNKENAMKMLKAKLYQLEEEKRLVQNQELRGEHKQGSWGNQIRSYVYQPYQMVKDHRTDAETSAIDDVVDGNLDLFVEKFLEWNKAGG